ncbi:MAG: BrnA antitoxin family protein [Proteobacteria bacterium]|nr:BrnA antitoxin family protein [Pseudomonadota bacterium]
MKESKRILGSNFAKIDAHTMQPEEYKEIPELTTEWFEQADLHIDGKLIRRGRPKSSNNKVLLSVRYNPEVVEYFRSTGDGWQTKMDEALKEWVKDHAF